MCRLLNSFSFFAGLLIVFNCFGSKTVWPHWLDRKGVVTLELPSNLKELEKLGVNSIQIESTSEWEKSGTASLGFLDKAGRFWPKTQVEYSESGFADILVDQRFIISNDLKVMTADASMVLGSAQVLASVQEVVVRNTKHMPPFNIIRQQFEMSGEYVLLEKPIQIDNISVSALYFENYFSRYPGSQVFFGNIGPKGVFIDAPVNSRKWDYMLGEGKILIRLNTHSSDDLIIARGTDRTTALLIGDKIDTIQILSLKVVSEKEYFIREPSVESIKFCSNLLKTR